MPVAGEPAGGGKADERAEQNGAESTSGAARDSESALMTQIADGDQDAFAELYDRWAGDVYRLALRVLGDRDRAEDITQDVLLTAWRDAGAYDSSKGTLRTWLLMLTHRRCVDRIRSETAARKREARDAQHRRVRSGVDVVAEEALQHFERQRVAHALQSLSDLQREALHLAYFSGHTYREVAELLGAPLGTVKTRLRDGLLRLRRELGGAA